MKRFISLILAFALAVSMLAGCEYLPELPSTPSDPESSGGSNNENDNNESPSGPADPTDPSDPSDSSDPSDPQEPSYDYSGMDFDESLAYDGRQVFLEIYHIFSPSYDKILHDAIARFNLLYPNVKIDTNYMGSMDHVYNCTWTEMIYGRVPNIVFCYPNDVATYLKYDAVLPLDIPMNSDAVVYREDGSSEIMGYTDEQLEDFVPSFLNGGRLYDRSGTTYYIPFSRVPEVMYYNATFFENEGLEVPDTWDEMETVMATIKERYPSMVPLSVDSSDNLLATLSAQLGTPIISHSDGGSLNLDNEVCRTVLSRLREWCEKGYLVTSDIYGNYTSVLFSEGASVMSIASPSASRWYELKNMETGVALVPSVNPDMRQYMAGGQSLCMFKNKDPQVMAASWLFVKFLTTDVQLQAEFALQHNYAPVIRSAYEYPALKDLVASAEGGNLSALVMSEIIKLDGKGVIHLPPIHDEGKLTYELSDFVTDVLVKKTDDLGKLITDEINDTEEWYEEIKKELKKLMK